MLKCSFIPAFMFICFHGPIFPPFIPYVSRTRELVDLFCYIPCPLSVAFISMFLCSYVSCSRVRADLFSYSLRSLSRPFVPYSLFGGYIPSFHVLFDLCSHAPFGNLFPCSYVPMFLYSHVPMFLCFCLPCSPFPVFMFLSSYVRCSLFSASIFLCSNCLCTRWTKFHFSERQHFRLEPDRLLYRYGLFYFTLPCVANWWRGVCVSCVIVYSM